MKPDDSLTPEDETAAVESDAEPVAEAPVAPANDEPATEEPATDEPAADQLVTDEPEADEAAEEPVAEEPVAEEPPPLTPEARRWALQCVLFVAGEPLPVNRVSQALGCEDVDVPVLCRELNERLAGQGLHVVQLAGGWALATRPEYADYVQRLLEPEPERLSVQALETLAIIAYRQPITRPEVDALRGVNSGGVVASLLEKGLLRITGRKDAPGRPFLLETTAHFLSAFGLKDLADLPRLELPEVPTAEQPKLLGEALEELSTATQEEAPSAAED